MIYFDNASTTYPKPNEVYDFIDKFNRENTFNIYRGNYNSALNASNIVSETRKLMLKLVNANQSIYQTVFTPSATMSLNMVLQGFNYKNVKNVYISPFEHNAVLRTLYSLQKVYKFNIIKLNFENYDHIEYKSENIKNQFNNSPPNILILSHVSNVCGYITPILEISKIAKSYNSIVVVDGSQSVGLVDIDLEDGNIDFLVFAGHKTLFSIFGSAGFIMKNSTYLSPIIFGGTGINSSSKDMPNQIPEKFEPGSLNILSIAALNSSIKWIINKGTKHILEKEKELSNKLKECLNQFSNINIVGENNGVGIISSVFASYSPDEIGSLLNQKNIAVRAGLHCSPTSHKFLGTFPNGTVRFSLSYFNTYKDILHLEKVLKYIYNNS